MIEKLDYTIHDGDERNREMLSGEEYYQHLYAIAERLFTKKNEIGFGNYSSVFRDEAVNGLCYKKIKPAVDSYNNVHEEAAFLKELSGVSESVKVPRPIVSMIVSVRNSRGLVRHEEVLAMEEMDAVNLEKALQGEELFPDTFNVETFFTDLKTFVQRMNEEFGIYHRDLQDRNVMIDKETGKPVLIDFGDAYKKVLTDDDPYKGRKLIDTVELDKLKDRVVRHLTKNG